MKSHLKPLMPSEDKNVAIETGTSVPQSSGIESFWADWFHAFKQVCPLYVIIHVVIFVITSLAMLYTQPLGDFTRSHLSLSTLLSVWNRLDTTYFDSVASHSYTQAFQTAFFPLQSLLIRALILLIPDTFIAGLIISNFSALIMMTVLYRLVKHDFDTERAERTVLYLLVFPTAFFFFAAYNESLFLCLALISFYHMRCGNWWLAGIVGLFACLARSAGIFLLVPFAFEYLCQHHFKIKQIRLNFISIVFLPAGLSIFAMYCYWRFGDLLAFSHAQANWNRHIEMPWYGMFNSLKIIYHSHILSFYGLRNLTDLLPSLFILALLVLCFVGPWRLPRSYWSYGFYAVTLYLFIQIVPVDASTGIPLQSVGRLMLEIFPAFIVLAAIGKNRTVHLGYLLISSSIFFFLLTQFVTQRWMV